MNVTYKPSLLTKRTVLSTFLFLFGVLVFLALQRINNNVDQAIVIAQNNRGKMAEAEDIVRTLLRVENKFKTYCITFEKENFAAYHEELNALTTKIKKIENDFANENNHRIIGTINQKYSEQERYAKIRTLIDSLAISSVEFSDLQANKELLKIKIEQFPNGGRRIRIDTTSITEITETEKKGIVGRIKNFITGSKNTQVVNRKINILSEQNADSISIVAESGIGSNSAVVEIDPRFKQLVEKSLEIRESEQRLMGLNETLFLDISQIVYEIKSDITASEASKNSLFVALITRSVLVLQNIVIGLSIVVGAILIYHIRSKKTLQTNH